MFESETENVQNPPSGKRLSLRQFEKVNNPRSIHGIYPYRGKMSSLDASYVIKQLPSESLLLDPFCGTGTILYEAQAQGLNTIGVDNNPLACTIARGKTEPLNKAVTISQIEKTIERARSLSESETMPSQPAK